MRKKEEGIWVTHDGSTQSILILIILIVQGYNSSHLLICLLNKQVRKIKYNKKDAFLLFNVIIFKLVV